jgi:hypothetical protein
LIRIGEIRRCCADRDKQRQSDGDDRAAFQKPSFPSTGGNDVSLITLSVREPWSGLRRFLDSESFFLVS